jgi:TPR repeat protein
MKSRKFIAAAMLALLMGIAGCASQPERDDNLTRFERARAAYLAEDFELALELMKEEAQVGNPQAQYALGYMYYNGQGVVPDMEQGLQWIQAAAAKGDKHALEALGRLASAATRPAPPKPDNNLQAPR